LRKEISGIGSGRQAILMANGIETACDIERSRVLRIRGFGPALVGNLLDWKHRMSAGFRFDPKEKIPASELIACTF
jgi:DNA-binding helix-hairpin-helix protein with protein kinase domain